MSLDSIPERSARGHRERSPAGAPAPPGLDADHRRPWPFMAVVLAFVLAKASLRPDIDQLPMWLSWGCSILQLALGVLLIGLALREADPRRGHPERRRPHRRADRPRGADPRRHRDLDLFACDHHARQRHRARDRLSQTRNRHGPADLRRDPVAGLPRPSAAGAHRRSSRRRGRHRGIGCGHSPPLSHVQSLPRPGVALRRGHSLHGHRLGRGDDLGAPSLAQNGLTSTPGGFTVPPDDRRHDKDTRRRTGGRP